MPTSVLRRYTPPTCTLEIAANQSPLSRWTNRPVLKQVRFQLTFDDPQLVSEEHVVVRGDRNQLEALSSAVQAYVQQLLDPAPARLNAAFLRLSPTGATTGVEGRSSENGLSENGLSENGLSETTHLQGNPGQNGSSPHGIYLQPEGLLAHDLHLGTLATEAVSVIRLSALQLFDLANALDEYAADALALPALGNSGRRFSSLGLAPIAAGILLTVGVTATMGRFVWEIASSDPQPAATIATQEASPPDQQISLAPGDPATKVPTISPDGVSPLPPPPPIGTTLPPAGSGLPSVMVPQDVPRTAPPPTIPRASAPIPTLPPPQVVGSAPAPTITRIPAQPDSQAIARSNPEAARSTNPEAAGIAPNADIAALQVSPSPTANRGTAFDVIPQVAEARNYFRDRWQPPEALNQVLEYRLVVNPNGTIDRIIPLGQASGDFVDRTGIPLVGDPFVSPIESGQAANIRLVLSPDGTVQTFLEGN